MKVIRGSVVCAALLVSACGGGVTQTASSTVAPVATIPTAPTTFSNGVPAPGWNSEKIADVNHWLSEGYKIYIIKDDFIYLGAIRGHSLFARLIHKKKDGASTGTQHFNCAQGYSKLNDDEKRYYRSDVAPGTVGYAMWKDVCGE